ncbi:MAG TPA: dual specificity protein phosphatase family protein [Acidocella sp.]|nr:dual specificity protein phosphatase family protein [Acidocella sp.]
MKNEIQILYIALGVLGLGIALLLVDMARRARRKRDEKPIDTSVFMQSLSGEELRFVAGADDSGFRQTSHESELAELEQRFKKAKNSKHKKKLEVAYLPVEPAEDKQLLDYIDLPPVPEEPVPAQVVEPQIELVSEPHPEAILHHIDLPPEPMAVEPAPQAAETEKVELFDLHPVAEPVLEPMGEPAPQPEAAILTCAGFGVGFGGKVILDNVTLTIPTQGITTLMGPVGTGKSTLLRSLAGLYGQNALFKSWGGALFKGQPITVDNRPLLVAQRIQLTQRSALESLLFHVKDQMEGVPEAEQRDWASQWLRQVGAENMIGELDVPFMELDQLGQRIVTILREAAAASALLMIDEPTSGLSDADAEIVLNLLRTLGAHGALLVVLHNQKQARRISDEIILLAGGRVQEQAAPEAFFSNTANPVVAQFVATGSVAVPAPDAPAETLAEHVQPPAPLSAAAMTAIKSEIRAALEPEPVVEAPAPVTPAAVAPAPAPAPAEPPRHEHEHVAVTRYPGASSGPRGFVWIEDGRLAATPMPGISADVDYDLDLLKNAGVTTLITLTEQDFPQDALTRHGLKNVHLPIVDRKAPTPAEMDMLVARMRDLMDNGKVLAVHCLAGLGRTGTILAAYLVKEKGMSAQGALNQIRRFNRQFVQSDDQEDFLVEYEVQQEQALLRNRAADAAKQS